MNTERDPLQQAFPEAPPSMELIVNLFDGIDGMNRQWDLESSHSITVHAQGMESLHGSAGEMRALYNPDFNVVRAIANKYGSRDVVEVIKYQLLVVDPLGRQVPRFVRHIHFPQRYPRKDRRIIGSPVILIHDSSGDDTEDGTPLLQVGSFSAKLGDGAETTFTYRRMHTVQKQDDYEKMVNILLRIVQSKPQSATHV